MAFIIANFDKQQYFRPQAFGAPQLPGGFTVAQRHTEAGHHAWLTLLLALLERTAGVELSGRKTPEALCWHADRVVLLRDDDPDDSLVPEDVLAMQALAGQGQMSSWAYAFTCFKDVSMGLRGWWSAQPETFLAHAVVRPRAANPGARGQQAVPALRLAEAQ